MLIRCSWNFLRKYNFRNFFVLVLIVVVLSTFSLLLVNVSLGGSYRMVKTNVSSVPRERRKTTVKVMEKVVVPANATLSRSRDNRCNYYNCFDTYKCGKDGEQQIQVYVYPMKNYVSEENVPVVRQLSKEFYAIMRTVTRSKYYTPDPHQACIFVPPFDTLAQDNFLAKETSQALNSLSL